MPGFELSDDLTHKKHIEKRKSLTISATMKLKNLGLITNQTHPNMKAHLYKTYIRPTLVFGLENILLTKKVVNELKRFEGNLVKGMLNISTRCRTTCLFMSLNIMLTEIYLNNPKMDFFKRIVENDFTKKLTIELANQTVTDDFIGEIFELTKDLDHSDMTLLEKCEFKKKMIMSDYKTNQKNDEKVQRLRKAFENKDKDKIPGLIYQICRFDSE